MRADDQPHVLQPQVDLRQRQLQMPERAGLVHAGVDQHDPVALRDRPRVAVRHARPRQRQPQPPDPRQHPLAPAELAPACGGIGDIRRVTLATAPLAHDARSGEDGAGSRNTEACERCCDGLGCGGGAGDGARRGRRAGGDASGVHVAGPGNGTYIVKSTGGTPADVLAVAFTGSGFTFTAGTDTALAPGECHVHGHCDDGHLHGFQRARSSSTSAPATTRSPGRGDGSVRGCGRSGRRRGHAQDRLVRAVLHWP